MFEKASIILLAACVCALPVRASAFTCEPTCENDVAVGERLPAAALGVLMYSWDGEIEEDTSAEWDVRVEREGADGLFGVVPHTLTTVPYLGAVIRPEQMSVGDVFRVETGVGTASDVCGEPGGSSPVHTFEVVETPTPGDFDGLTVSPPTLAEETDEYVDIIERTGTGRTFVARVSTVGVEVALPPEFEALAGSVRVEFYLDNDLMLRERSLCVPALHWKNQQVVDGVIAEDFATICEVIDDSQREATDGIQRDFQRLDGVMRARIFVPGTTLEWWSEEEPLVL